MLSLGTVATFPRELMAAILAVCACGHATVSQHYAAVGGDVTVDVIEVERSDATSIKVRWRIHNGTNRLFRFYGYDDASPIVGLQARPTPDSDWRAWPEEGASICGTGLDFQPVAPGETFTFTTMLDAGPAFQRIRLISREMDLPWSPAVETTVSTEPGPKVHRAGLPSSISVR